MRIKSQTLKIVEKKEKKKNRIKNKDQYFILTCMTPAVLLFSLFILYPLAQTLYMSFFRFTGLGGEAIFVGLQNFKLLFTDSIFITSLKNMVWFLCFFPLITMILAMFLAVILTQGKLHTLEQKFFKLIIFFPNILSMVIVGILFLYIFDYNLGVLNGALELFGLGELKSTWLGQSNTVLWALVTTMVWQATGYYMVMYMAGINQIPKDLYEAAELDGANNFVQFLKITVPLVWEIIRVTLVFFITSSVNLTFIFVSVMTKGGPNNASQVPLTYMYQQAFNNANYGYAMSIAVIVLVIAITLSYIIQKVTDKEIIEF